MKSFCISVLIFLFALQLVNFAQDKDTYAKVNGADLWYQIKGEGDPIVLIPGGPGSSHLYFTPFMNALKS